MQAHRTIDRSTGLIALLGATSIIVSASGCGGGGKGSPSPTPCATVAPLLSVIVPQIFTPSCALSGCHSATSPQDSLDLSSASEVLATASNVLAVETFNQEEATIVVPGSHATSYMWLKLTDANGITDSPMPLSGHLDSCQIDAIAGWIDAGAQDD
jgi:hypothetical protein